MWNLMQGDLGRSFQFFCSSWATERTVKEIVGDRIWTTVALTGFTIIVTWTFAIPVGHILRGAPALGGRLPVHPR